MAAHARVKKKTLTGGISLSSFSDVGDSMTANLHDPELARKKCARILKSVLAFSTMINNVRDLKVFTAPTSQFNAQCIKCEQFLRESSRALFGSDTMPLDAESAPFREQMSDSTFREIYTNIRDHDIVRIIILACDALDPYKASIGDANALNGKFLEDMPGISFTPFADFDVKDAYLQTPVTEVTRRKYILTYIHKLYTLGKALYYDYIMPDMNVDKMVDVVRNAIAQLRRIPELSGCDIAFDTIEQSIGLLHDNFGQYYVDFAVSRHPSSIFESFVSDVAKQETGAQDEPIDPLDARAVRKARSRRMRHARLTQQFSRIIAFYQEHAGKSSRKNPQAEMLLNHYKGLSSRLNLRNLSQDTPSEEPAPASDPANRAPSATESSRDSETSDRT